MTNTQADTDIADLVRAIRALASDGALPSERRLAEMLEVKRHQLRKALGSLRQTGELANPRRRRPGPVPDLADLANPLEVIELRLILEPNFARLASLRASGSQIARILAAASTPPAARPGEVDLAFHSAIADAARNNLGAAFYATLRTVGTDARLRLAGTGGAVCPTRLQRRDAEHRKIAEAIAARDPDAAEAQMRHHLAAVEQLIVARSSPDRTRAA